MSAFALSNHMMLQSQQMSEEYRQHLLMTAAFCNYQVPEPHVTMTPPPLECEAELLNADLWNQFHDLGTEMIITKNGRRMFPSLSVQLKGLKPDEQYAVSIEMWATGGGRWTRAGGTWAAAPHGLHAPSHATSQSGALHPDSPAPAARWEQPVNFNRLKLTNNLNDNSGNIVLTSMYKYQPRIRVTRVGGPWPAEKCFVFPETEFIAVTAYQNDQITKLKIDNNPFAKGFREYGQGRCKRKANSPLLGKSADSSKSTAEEQSSDRCTENLSAELKEMPLEKMPRHSPPSPNQRITLESHVDDSGRSAISIASSRVSTCSSSFSSESPRPNSISPIPEYPQHLSHEEARYLQLAEWARCVMYGGSVWIPAVPLPQPPPCWHYPTPPSPPSPPTPACRPLPPPKGSSFTIRALIGEN